MFSVESSFSLKNFIFGFRDPEKKEFVAGYYDRKKKEFVIDFAKGSMDGFIREFKESGKRYSYANLWGFGFDSYEEVCEKKYLLDQSFFIYYSNVIGSTDGLLIIPEDGCFEAPVGLSGGYVWSTGNLYENCRIELGYFDYFDDLSIEIHPKDGVMPVRTGVLELEKQVIEGEVVVDESDTTAATDMEEKTVPEENTSELPVSESTTEVDIKEDGEEEKENSDAMSFFDDDDGEEFDFPPFDLGV